MSELPPFLPNFLAALLVPVTPALVRNILLRATPVVAFLHIWFNIHAGTAATWSILDFELVYLRADKLSLLFS